MIHLQPYNGEYCLLCLCITNIDDSNSNTQQDTRKDDSNNDSLLQILQNGGIWPFSPNYLLFANFTLFCFFFLFFGLNFISNNNII